MNKLQTIKKQVTRQAVMIGGAVIAAFALMMVTGFLADSALERKNQAQSQYTQAESQLGMMRSQLSKSDDAEKRYTDIKLSRDNEDFLNDTEKLKDHLKEMKDQYRFSDAMRLSISTDKVAENPEFSALNYNVIWREDMEMTTGAISDVHIYSFLQDMKRSMPGLIRITHLNLTRKSAMSMQNLAQLGAGNKLDLVDASVKFTWLTIQDKNPPAAESANTPPVVGGVQ